MSHTFPSAAMSQPRARRLLAACALALLAPALQAQPVKAVHDLATNYKAESLQLLEKLVNIDSGSGDFAGLEQVRGVVVDELTRLGGKIETFPATPHPGKNVTATFEGTGTRKILLMAHIDTVFAPGTAKAKPFYVKDDRAYGPGVMDNKGGVVAGIYAIKILNALNFKDYARLTFLIDTNEEVGSVETTALIRRVAKAHDVVLNLEPGRPADGLVVWRKGSATAVVEVKGRAAHAGVAPASGRNAATELAHQVLQLGKLGDADKATTIHFTVLNANGPTNVIPENASAKGDVRALNREELDRVERDLARVSQNKLIPDTEVKTSLNRGLPPMAQTPQIDALAATAESIYAEIGKKLTLEGSGGAADASLAADEGVPTLDGFGIVGGGIHTTGEYAEVGSVVPRLYLLSRMVMEVSKPR
jgi:glutamate carboxypeptidase